MRLRRKKDINTEGALALSVDGVGQVTEFPASVIRNLRHMVTRISYKESLPRRLSLVSAIREEGVTYISRALGAVIAHDLQAAVCVVELNWWSPSATFDQYGGDRNLASLLLEEVTLDEAVLATSIPNLSLLPAGSINQMQRPIVARSDALKAVVRELGNRFDYIILDTPAMRTTSDAISLASLGEACCLVVRQGVTSLEDVKIALDDLSHLPMLGVIMNQVQLKTPSVLLKLIPQN